MNDLPPFPGFRPQAFAFLRDLAANNDRDWFKPRKETYDDEVLWPMKCLVSDLANRAVVEGLPLTGDPNRAIFRIYRDTRFSKNKQPYKTHQGAVLTRSGVRDEHGGVYIHFQPGQSMVAAGFWRLEPEAVRLWRSQLAAEPVSFLEAVRSAEAAGMQMESDEVLKRMPRGYEAHADTEIGRYLRWKSFYAMRSVADEELTGPAFTDAVLEVMRATLPLLTYGWALESATRRGR